MAVRNSYRALAARLRPSASALTACSVALLVALPGFGNAASTTPSAGFTVPEEKALPGFEVTEMTPASAAPAATIVRPKVVAGRYALTRDDGKDRGCVLTLADTGNGNGSFSASLSPSCKDQGLQVFDPAAWQIDNDKLILSARKGHNTVRFAQQADGRWQKDDELSRPLMLKKL